MSIRIGMRHAMQRIVYVAIFICAPLFAGNPAKAEVIGWTCNFGPGASPLMQVLIEHDMDTNNIIISADHLVGSDMVGNIQTHFSNDEVEYIHELTRNGRLQQMDIYRINVGTGEAVGIVEFFSEDGRLIIGSPRPVEGYCWPGRLTDPQPVGQDFGTSTGICVTDNVGTQYVDRLRYCVSSVLAPQSGNTYGPENIYRGTDTAWCEGVPGHGEGQRVNVEADSSIVIYGLNIMNGYQKTTQTYFNNSRPRTIEVEASGRTQRFTLADMMGTQYLRFSTPIETTSLNLWIIDAYPGERWADTCITWLWLDLEGF